MSHKLINIEAATIQKITRREGDAAPYDVIQVLDEEGEEQYLFPPVLAVAEVKAILREINYAYDKGYDVGSAARARAVCEALGFNPEMLESNND